LVFDYFFPYHNFLIFPVLHVACNTTVTTQLPPY
jgi:hypothetical protein